MKHTDHLNIQGSPDAPILVIADAPSPTVFDTGNVMTGPQMNLLRKMAEGCGLKGKDFCILTPCPSIPEEISTSENKVGKFLAEYRDEFIAAIGDMNPMVVVTLGKTALRQLAGAPVQITKARGSFTTYAATGSVPVLPLFSTAHALRRPEALPVFQSDFQQLGALQDAQWDVGTFEKATDTADYEWCLDLEPLLENPPQRLALDTETKGLDWRGNKHAILTVALTTREGHAYVIPLNADYFNDDALRGESTKNLPKIDGKKVIRLTDQLRELLGNPNVRVTGHNLKYDIHHCKNYGVLISNWFADTMQLAFAVDDNMQTKSLDECTRRWVPALAGYADAFNADPIHQGKSRMDLVPHDKMLRYAGGDTDACFRLTEVLCKLCKQDSRQWRVFRGVMMPGLRSFVRMERAGMGVDTDALVELGAKYDALEKQLYTDLITEAAQFAPAVLRKHESDGLSFSRANFVADLLFTEDGLNLTPKVFTKSTAKGSEEEKMPSVSSKTHLPFFDHVPFVVKLMEYQKVAKLRSTYIGVKGGEYFTMVQRLKSGRLPVRAEEHLIAAGLDFPKKKLSPVRRRTPLPESPVLPINDANGFILDSGGYVWRKDTQEPSGFWQYLTPGTRRVHPNFRLDVTVTGRTSCITGDALISTDKGELPLSEVVDRFSGGEVFHVKGHSGNFRQLRNAWLVGKRGIMDVKLNNGTSLRCTSDHRVLVRDGDSIMWMQAVDILRATSSGRNIEVAMCV